MNTPTTTSLPPIVKTLSLRCTADHAFTVYTERIGDWWPTSDFSISGSDVVSVHLEPRTGGLVYETNPAGERLPWGTMSVWEPKRHLTYSWHPGSDPTTATEVDVRFTPNDAGCEMVLEHRGWKSDADSLQSRSAYDEGWDVVLQPYVELVGS
ncbi:MAG: SRPBCC domain-containing protein [Nocardioidaceae bacterium]